MKGYIENINYNSENQKYELKIYIEPTSDTGNLSTFLHDELYGKAQIIIKHESILSLLK
jgi:hypothetical protein